MKLCSHHFCPSQARPGQPDTLSSESSLGITESPNCRIVEVRILPNRRIAKRVCTIELTIRRELINPGCAP